MPKFNPNDYLVNLKGKQYLPVQGRQLWFRDLHPRGTILTEPVSFSPLLFKATILDEEGHVLATGHAGAPDTGGKAVWAGREPEKAETAAIGRALASAGFGTQFCDEFDDTTHLSDSPREAKPAAATPQKPIDMKAAAGHIEDLAHVFGVSDESATAMFQKYKASFADYQGDRSMAGILFSEAEARYAMTVQDVLDLLGVDRVSEYLASATLADAWTAIKTIKEGK